MLKALRPDLFAEVASTREDPADVVLRYKSTATSSAFAVKDHIASSIKSASDRMRGKTKQEGDKFDTFPDFRLRPYISHRSVRKMVPTDSCPKLPAFSSVDKDLMGSSVSTSTVTLTISDIRAIHESLRANLSSTHVSALFFKQLQTELLDDDGNLYTEVPYDHLRDLLAIWAEVTVDMVGHAADAMMQLLARLRTALLAKSKLEQASKDVLISALPSSSHIFGPSALSVLQYDQKRSLERSAYRQSTGSDSRSASRSKSGNNSSRRDRFPRKPSRGRGRGQDRRGRGRGGQFNAGSRGGRGAGKQPL